MLLSFRIMACGWWGQDELEIFMSYYVYNHCSWLCPFHLVDTGFSMHLVLVSTLNLSNWKLM